MLGKLEGHNMRTSLFYGCNNNNANSIPSFWYVSTRNIERVSNEIETSSFNDKQNRFWLTSLEPTGRKISKTYSSKLTDYYVNWRMLTMEKKGFSTGKNGKNSLKDWMNFSAILWTPIKKICSGNVDSVINLDTLTLKTYLEQLYKPDILLT